MIDNAHRIELDQRWREKFPSTLSGLFCFYQCLCTIAIIGCEVGSILIDLYNATIYVGFWASLVFMIAWISQTIAVTCRRTRKWAKYTLIIQCINLIFSGCLIGFDAYFLINPAACFFSSTLCSSAAPIRGLFYSEDHFSSIKIPLIKGQLAIGAVMFAFSIDYIIMYVVTCKRSKNSIQSLPKMATNNTVSRNPTDIGIVLTNENTMMSSPLPVTDRNITLSTFTTSGPLSAKSLNHSRWSIDSSELNPVKI